jgi:pSer/pThr/pTyr-binding forkhead associated (FHA) protein
MLKVLLIVVQGKPEGKTIPITGPRFVIGRGVDCHLRPNSEEVSRNHAEIVVTETEAVVRDLGSRNGTRINGKLLTGSHRLKSGELLQVGPLTFAIAIQGATPEAESLPRQPGAAAAPAARAASLDDVPHDQIEAWLVSDRSNPTPDRPSGVYDGDTLTLEAYKELATPKPDAGASSSTPAEAKSTAPPARAAGEAGPVSFEEHLEGIERLPEGMGDEPTGLDAEHEEEEEKEGVTDEFEDESNPFYMAKKAAAAAESAATKKPSYNDSSEAASDILKKMLERRRAPR